MHLIRSIRKRIGNIAYALENRRLAHLGLRRSRWEREYPREPGTLEGLDPDHMFRYEWARPFCEDKRVLDYGCGVGYGGYLLSEVAKSVRGFDISPDALAWAQHYTAQRGNLEYSTDLPDGKFDCITCFECIEHVPDPDATLGWLAEHTSDYLFISTPSAKPGKWSSFHTKEFTREQFLSMLEARFRVEHVEEQLTNGCTVYLARCRRLPEESEGALI